MEYSRIFSYNTGGKETFFVTLEPEIGFEKRLSEKLVLTRDQSLKIVELA